MKNPLYRSKSPGPSVSMCQLPVRGCYRHRVGHPWRWAGATREPARGRGPLSRFAHEAPRSGGLRAREARSRRRRKSFRQAGGNAQSSLQGFRCDRERALPRFCGCVVFLKISFFFWFWLFVGLASLVWVLGLTRRARLRKCTCLLSFFLSFAAAIHDDHLRRSGVPLFLC